MTYKEFGATIAPSNVSSTGFPIAMGSHIGGGRTINGKNNLKLWQLLGDGADITEQKANAIGQIWYDTLDNKYWKLDSWASTNPVWVDVSTIFATKSYVDIAIENIPDPMIFKGSLGTGGTITSLPTASTSNTGFTYKVITAGTYAGQVAKIGDTFISDGTIWNLIPSGDDAGGTVTSITLNATSPILIDDSNAITTSGTRTFSHASTSGNKHIPSGGNSNNYLKWDSDGTATWSALPTASTSVAGVTTVGASGGAASYVHTHAKSDITDFAHTHAKSDITDFAHSHGNITNTGTISSTVITPASTDYILLSDTSNSGKVERGIAIGSSTSTYLRNDGTWVTPPDTNTTYSIFTTTTDGLVPKTTTSNTTDYLRRDGTWATPPNNNSTTHLYVGASGTTTNGTTTNGNTYIKLFDDSTAREQYKISGSGPSVVTSDATGNIIVGISDNSIGATQLNVTGNGTTTQYLRSDGDGSFTWADITSSNVTTALGYTPYNNTNPNGYTTNTGTVTNIVTGNGLTGGPITTTGTIGLAPTYGDTVNPYASKTAKWVLAAPNTADGVPSFRELVASDIPTLNQNTTGSAGSVISSIRFHNEGTGDASGTTYNGSAARTISYNTIGAVPSGRVITAGDGLTGGGNLTADRTLTLGTPGTLDNSTTNSVTSTSHTHAITFPNFYKADHSIVPSPNFNDIWGDENNVWQCRSDMYNGVRDDFGYVDSNQMGDYSTSILIQYGTDPLKKMQMLFIDTSVSNVSMNGIFYRFRNSPWMRMLDTSDYNNLDQQITNNYNNLDQQITNNYNSLVQWVNNNFEPKQTTANMPLPVGAGSVITITDAYINKFIKTTTPISNGTIEIKYWESYLETEIHLTTGATVPTLNIEPGYKRVNLPGSLMPNTTYIIAIKNGVITFAKSI